MKNYQKDFYNYMLYLDLIQFRIDILIQLTSPARRTAMDSDTHGLAQMDAAQNKFGSAMGKMIVVMVVMKTVLFATKTIVTSQSSCVITMSA